MRNILFYSVAIILLSACSEDVTQVPSTSPPAQTQQQLKPQETPKSLSGNEKHLGPNPHARLSAEQHIAVAMRHADEGRLDEALDVLTRAIAETPNNPSLIGTRGSVLLGQNRVYDALVDLEKAVSLAPESALLLINRSQAYLKFRRYEDAMADLNKAVDLNPQLVPARFNRGILLYDEGKFKEALTDFNICIQVDSETAGPYFNRAVTHNTLGNKTGAVSDMNKFIELADNPQWVKVAQDTLAAWEKENHQDL